MWGEVPHGHGLWEEKKLGVTYTLTQAIDPLSEVKKLGVTDTVTLTGATDPLREVKELGVTDTVTLTEATDWPEGGEEAWGDWHSDTDRSHWPAWGRWRSLGWPTQWHWQKLLTGLREVKELGVTDTVTGATDWPEGGEGAWGDWHSDIDRSYWSHSLNRPQSHASLNLGEAGPLLVLVANYQLRSSALPLRKYFPAPPPPPPPPDIHIL